MFKTHRTYDLTTGCKSASIAVIAEGSHVDVILHDTTVVTQRGKTVTLDSGGWDTVSTRTVINRALELLGMPYYLGRTKKTTWLIDRTENRMVRPFRDGMTLAVANG